MESSVKLLLAIPVLAEPSARAQEADGPCADRAADAAEHHVDRIDRVADAVLPAGLE